MLAIETLLAFQENGHKLILWTCREDSKERAYLDEAVHFCMTRGLIFDAINENVADSPFAHLAEGIVARKVYADYYIDDKAMFPLWEAYAGGVL